MLHALVAMFLVLGSANSVLPAEALSTELLDRVTTRVTEAIGRFPNYTCTEYIIRQTLAGQPAELIVADRVRLDIAVVNGREIFSWPGADKFDKHDPREIVGTGSITTGEYAGVMQTVFASGVVSFTDGVFETLGERRVLRFDYTVLESRYTIRSGGRTADVPFHGSFWVDASNEQILALQVIIEEIPSKLDICELRTLIEFEPPSENGIGLPASAEMTAKYRDSGRIIRNRIAFTGCKRYAGESKISFFDEAPLPQSLPQGVKSAGSVAPGALFEVGLDKRLGIDCAAGDPVVATVLKPVEVGGVRVPRGAHLVGRVIRCANWFNAPGGPQTEVALGFSRLEFTHHRLAFNGCMVDHSPLPGSNRRVARVPRGSGCADSVVLRGPALELPAGFRMRWRSRTNVRRDSAARVNGVS